MHSLDSKLAQLKWLNAQGVKYYLSEEKIDPHHLSNQLRVYAQKQPQASKEQITPKKTPEAIKGDEALMPIKNNQNKEHLNNTDLVTDKTYQELEKVNSLEELKQFVENFEGCDLKKFALNTVFADGNKTAKILLIGEAPGAVEDEKAIPFCGDSGKLLDLMIASIGLSRANNAYVTNSIFWRPPGNRPPTQQEINICRPMVEKHIALIAPKIIILVGRTAFTALMGKNDNMQNMRQNSYYYSNRYIKEPILTKVIFHPSYLFRKPICKKDTWFDLLSIKKIAIKMGIL
jgi:DNA polymerase